MLEWLFGKRKQEAPKPKKKDHAQQQKEDKWKYDFLVQFLSGPLWKTSILDFVDYHCVVFDNEEENKFEYTTIHNKFKELVGSLFDGMVQEVGLDDDQLAQLLEKGLESKQKKIFNQLFLVDDFVRFKTLMVNRNKALEAQAIKALGQKIPSAKEKPSKPTKINEQDVIRQSKRAESERKRLEEEEEQALRKVLEMSRLQAEEADIIKKMEAKIEEKEIRQSKPVQQEHKIQQKKIKQVVSQKQSVEQPPKSALHDAPTILPPVRRRKKVQQSPKVEQSPKIEEKHQIKKQAQLPPPQPEPKQPQAVVQQPVEHSEPAQSQQERKKRLLQQRQKMRKKKQEERRQQMVEEEAKPSQNVHTIVLQEDGIHETQFRAPEEEKKEKVSKEEIDRRRELMKKIKNRIVDDF